MKCVLSSFSFSTRAMNNRGPKMRYNRSALPGADIDNNQDRFSIASKWFNLAAAGKVCSKGCLSNGKAFPPHCLAHPSEAAAEACGSNPPVVEYLVGHQLLAEAKLLCVSGTD
eukprot:2982567-Rhodomonas_salina.1